MEVGRDGIESLGQGVHKNLIKSMPKWIGVVIRVIRAMGGGLHNNWFIECEYSKGHIKSISLGNVLIFGTNKVMIPYFVVRNSHRFSFVSWATIGLARNFCKM